MLRRIIRQARSEKNQHMGIHLPGMALKRCCQSDRLPDQGARRADVARALPQSGHQKAEGQKRP